MIRIFKTSLSSSSDSPEVLTAELGQQTSSGRRGLGPKSSGHRSPGGGASLLLNKRLTLPFLAFVAVLAATLGVLLAAQSAVSAQTASHISYAEDRKDPVATLTASDPERVGTTVWDLLTIDTGDQDITGDGNDNVDSDDVADSAAFKISDAGVLEFMTQPNFEDPGGLRPRRQRLPGNRAGLRRHDGRNSRLVQGGCHGHGRGRAGEDRVEHRSR